MNDVLLLEQSFADAAKAIEGAVDLPAQTRTQWLCSLRQIAKALDKPMEVIPARWTAARFPIDRLHHAVVGLNPKTQGQCSGGSALVRKGGRCPEPRIAARRGMAGPAPTTDRSTNPRNALVPDALLLRPEGCTGGGR
jgi:hypothetical protein